MKLKSLALSVDKYIYYLLLFTVAVIPLRQHFTAFCVFASFAAAVFAALAGARRGSGVLRNWEQVALYLLFLMCWVSLRFSRDIFQSSWNFVYVVGQYGAFFFVLLRYGWQRPDPFNKASGPVPGKGISGLWQRYLALPLPLELMGAFFATAFVVSVIGIAQKFLGVAAAGIWVDPDEFPELKVRVYSTLVNPNILGGYLVLVIAYAAAFFNQVTGKLWRGLFFALGLLCALCLLYTYSRGNWLACAAVLLAFCVCFCRKAFIPLLLGGAALLCVSGQAVIHRLLSVFAPSGMADTSIALRQAYLRSTEWIIEANPWGVGWYGYQFVYPEYNYYLADKSVIMYHCHNIFLNIWAEMGPQGLAAFLLVWFIFLRAAWRLAFRAHSFWLKAMGQGYLLASLGIAVGGLTDHVYFNSQMGLFFWFLGGLTLLCRKWDLFEV